MIELPKQAGTYALILRLDEKRRLTAGRLGEFELIPGTYIYLGSAFGPGGLRARLRRHLAGTGSPHWHIDALREIAPPIRAVYTLSDLHLECDWSQSLHALPDAIVPVPGFGASDCRSACPAHLVAFEGENFSFTLILNALRGASAPAKLHTLIV